MQGPKLSPEQHDDVVAFLHTLTFPPPLLPTPRDDADRALLERGRAIFGSWRCGECHIGPLTYTSQGTYDVGLRDEATLTKFNPPSLRGASQRSDYFHDGHTATLHDAIGVRRHPHPQEISGDQLRDLVSYLESL